MPVETPYRQYTAEGLGGDGYPPQWHDLLKHEVRERAGHRCVRCGHPYFVGEHPMEREEDADGKENRTGERKDE